MTDSAHDSEKGIADLDERDIRALNQYLTVEPVRGTDALYTVTSESQREYTVDLAEGRCTCKDHEMRGARCKHLRRVAYETGATALPAWIDTDALPGDFAAHVDAEPRFVTPDGGSDRAECWCADKALPCFEHYAGDA